MWDIQYSHQVAIANVQMRSVQNLSVLDHPANEVTSKASGGATVVMSIKGEQELSNVQLPITLSFPPCEVHLHS